MDSLPVSNNCDTSSLREATVGMEGTDISLPGNLDFETQEMDDFISEYCDKSIPLISATSLIF